MGYESIAHEAEGQKNIETKHLSQVKARDQSFLQPIITNLVGALRN